MMRLLTIKHLLEETLINWHKDKVSRLSAALAYYTIFSLAPLTVIFVAIVSIVFGHDLAKSEVLSQFNDLLGPDGTTQIKTMFEGASKTSSNKIATSIGIIILLIGATGLFGELQDGMDTIWNVKAKSRSWWKIIKDRFLSFAMVLGVGFLLLVSLIISALLSTFSSYFSTLIPGGYVLGFIINFIFSIAGITFLFALIFKILPDVQIRWKEVWLGAFITALLFNLGKILIGFYIGNSNLGTVYGAAGSLIVILVWVYYSAHILFFGAEFTKVHAKRMRSYIPPNKIAKPLSTRQKHKEKRYKN